MIKQKQGRYEAVYHNKNIVEFCVLAFFCVVASSQIFPLSERKGNHKFYTEK